MCDPISMTALATAAISVPMITGNQATQHAKGAVQAQTDAANAAAKAIGPTQTTSNPSTASTAFQAQDRARRAAALRQGMMSTIGTSPQGIPPITGGKTTLG
jgi:hypothetical protein